MTIRLLRNTAISVIIMCYLTPSQSSYISQKRW